MKKNNRKALAAIAVLIGIPILMNVFGLFIPKRYTAEMRLLVDQSLQRAQIAENPYQAIDDISEFDRPRSTQTQLDILTGTDVLEGALELAAQNLPGKINLDKDSSATYENLQRRTTVDNELNSDILSVRVTEDDPQVAAELANDIGQSYSNYIKTIAREGGSDELRALDKEINDSQAELTKMDEDIKEMKAKNHIFDVMQSGEAEAGTKSAMDQRLAQVSGEYRGAKAALSDAELELAKIPKIIPTGNRNAVNPTTINLDEALTGERATLADLEATYYPDFPLVKREKERIRNLEQQQRTIVKNIDAEQYTASNPVYQTQLENVQQYRGQVESLKHEMQSLQVSSENSAAILNGIPATEQVLQSRIRARSVAEQNYMALEQRRTILQAIGMARQPSARVVSRALPPSAPSFPDSRLLTLAGLALGAFFAILIVMPRPQSGDSYPTGYTASLGPDEASPLAPRAASEERAIRDDPTDGV